MLSKTINLKILAHAEVLVCGGGVAGVAAAVAAARNGADVMILEQNGCLGGMATAGMVPSFAPMSDGINILCGGIGEEIVREMCRRLGIKARFGTWENGWQGINPEILKCVFDDMLQEAGVQTLLNVKIADVMLGGGRIAGVIVATCEGLKLLTGRVFVDTTGDAVVAALAGAEIEIGGKDQLVMSPTLCVQYANVDHLRMEEEAKAGNTLWKIWFEHLQAGTTPFPEHHMVGLFHTGADSSLAGGNIGHIYGVNCLDEFELSRAYREGRRIARLYYDFFRQQVPGCEKAELLATASMLGIRESRRIVGEYCLDFNDYLKRASFADEIGRFYYPIDLHASEDDSEEQIASQRNLQSSIYKEGENYGIPYRCLIPKGLKNLLVAGRCLSADRRVLSSIRVMPGAMITGQAAGVAAALTREDVRDVDINDLRRRLRTLGAFLGSNDTAQTAINI